jgi:hypothetical protein
MQNAKCKLAFCILHFAFCILELPMRRLLTVIALLAIALSCSTAPAFAQGGALRVNPTSISQDETASLSASGFAPKEIISFWFTLPDYSVMSAGDLKANADGAVDGSVFISVDMPVGTYSLSARGNRSGTLASAPFVVKAAAGAPPSANVLLKVDHRTMAQGECFFFTGTGYTPSETIAVWLRLPDGAVTNAGLEGEFRAGSAGDFTYTICFGNLAAEGGYAFTAYGKSSQLTGVAEFTLARGDYINAPAGKAQLFVDPKVAHQLDTVSVVGGGFAPGERVSLWITLPNGVVLNLFSGTTADGTFQEQITLPPLPVGTHYISAYGQSSGLRAVAALDLLPGDGR